MTEHRTRIVLCRDGQYGYCTCGWVDIMRPDDGTALYAAAMHRRKATA